MPVIYSNNASTTLSAGINDSVTTIPIASASGFPSISGSNYFFATIANTNNTKIEVVKVTAGTTSLTVTRAQDGTTAQAFDSGDNFQLRVTAATLEAATKTDVNITGGAIAGAAITNDVIDSQHYAAASIDNEHLADNAVGTAEIADDAVTEAKLANAINSAIAANTAKTSNATHTGQVTGATALTIANDAVDSQHYAAGSIDAEHIASEAVTTAKIAGGNVTSAKLASDSVTTAKINDGDVTTAKLAADCITADKIGDNIINSEHYAADSIDAEHLNANSVNTDAIIDGAIATAHFATGCVDGPALATNSVNSAELIDEAVDLSHMSDNSVDSRCYVDGSIDEAHIADDAVTTGKIASLNVTGAKLANDRRSTNTAIDIYTGNAHDYIQFDGDVGMKFVTANGEDMRLLDDGTLHVDGDVIAFSTTISDERLKHDIEPITDALSKVGQLNGCTFTYNNEDKRSAGLIAQDVEKVLPSAVSEIELPLQHDDGIAYKTVQYDQTIGLLVEAIKELTAKVEKLENK